jgi:hypothetical protein
MTARNSLLSLRERLPEQVGQLQIFMMNMPPIGVPVCRLGAGYVHRIRSMGIPSNPGHHGE